MANDHDEQGTGYASPPCALHEIDPAYAGLDPARGDDLQRWRRAERDRQIAQRMALSLALRREHAARIIGLLEARLEWSEELVVSLYWPMRGEPDLRALAEKLVARGARCALPVVAARGQPLVFRAWVPGQRLERGAWNIPVPAEDTRVAPNVVLAPVVAFDRHCYRLGYGGGYYDRTLAAMAERPRVLGVGHAMAAVPTIYPQPHDVPMDAVVTESGIVTPADQ